MTILAVYDCMLFLRAAAQPERSRRTFEIVWDGTVTLCLSPPVLAEIRDVLTRPELQKKFPALTHRAVDAFLADCLRGTRWIAHVPEVFTLQRDPKDSKYVNLAIAARAPYLVTTDLDLLDLMKASAAEGRVFVQRFPNLRVLDPPTFVAEISGALPMSAS